MKLTKYVHSCLLAESEGQSVLFDPGIYSWSSGVFKLENLNKLDIVVITHEHPDHFSEEFVQAILNAFPEVLFITTSTVAERLKQTGAENISTESAGPIEIFSKKPHAPIKPLLDTPPPENIAVHFADKLTVGGDRHDLEESKPVLAFPITAPWGSVKQGAEMVMRLKPRYVLPVHDWHWHQAARQAEYSRSSDIYNSQGITFLKPVDGEPINVDS